MFPVKSEGVIVTCALRGESSAFVDAACRQALWSSRPPERPFKSLAQAGELSTELAEVAAGAA